MIRKDAFSASLDDCDNYLLYIAKIEYATKQLQIKVFLFLYVYMNNVQ